MMKKRPNVRLKPEYSVFLVIKLKTFSGCLYSI